MKAEHKHIRYPVLVFTLACIFCVVTCFKYVLCLNNVDDAVNISSPESITAPAKSDTSSPPSFKFEPVSYIEGPSDVIEQNLNFIDSIEAEKAQYVAELTELFPSFIRRRSQQVDTLVTESLSESLAHLHRVNMFYSPGGGSSSGSAIFYGHEFDFSTNIGIHDLRSIMGNRRFLKVLGDLRELGNTQAANTILTHLNEALKQHRNQFQSYIEANENQYIKELVKPDEWGAVTSPLLRNATKEGSNEHLITGDRYNALSSIWLAGLFNVKDSHKEIKSVALEMVRLRQYYIENENHHYTFGYFTLTDVSLYNRQILAYSLVQTSKNPDEIEERLSELGVNVNATYTAVAFDAPLTPYENSILFDRSLEDSAFDVGYYGNISDDVFEILVLELLDQ